MRTPRAYMPASPSHFCSRPFVLAAFVFCLLLICGPVRGQNTQWGISGGATSGGFLGDASAFAGRSQIGTELPARFAGRRAGFALGVHVRTELTRCVTARTALTFVQHGGVVKGVRLGPADGLVKETAEYQLDYMAIPLLAEARVPQQTVLGLQPSLYIGPELDLTLRARARRSYRTNRGEQNFTTEVETSPVVISAVTGTEIAYPFPTGEEVAVYVRYHYGLTDVTGGRGADARFGTIQAGVLIRFAQ